MNPGYENNDQWSKSFRLIVPTEIMRIAGLNKITKGLNKKATRKIRVAAIIGNALTTGYIGIEFLKYGLHYLLHVILLQTLVGDFRFSPTLPNQVV